MNYYSNDGRLYAYKVAAVARDIKCGFRNIGRFLTGKGRHHRKSKSYDDEVVFSVTTEEYTDATFDEAAEEDNSETEVLDHPVVEWDIVDNAPDPAEVLKNKMDDKPYIDALLNDEDDDDDD